MSVLQLCSMAAFFLLFFAVQLKQNLPIEQSVLFCIVCTIVGMLHQQHANNVCWFQLCLTFSSSPAIQSDFCMMHKLIE